MLPASGRCALGRAIYACASCVLAILLLSSSARAQVPDTSEIDSYLRAMTQPDVSARLAQLERFASSASAGSLRSDALEWIVWGEHQSRNDAASVTWARELLKSEPDNALALAVIADAERKQTPPGSARRPAYEDVAKRGLLNLPQLRRPEAMSYADFTRLRNQAEAWLAAAVGVSALQSKDYAAARFQLSRAVAASPDDASLVYLLALADLSGQKPDRQRGYWLLARAVNLSRGVPQGQQIEEFGRTKYKKDGGSDKDWEQYLAVTAVPGAAAATVTAAREDRIPGVMGSRSGSATASTRVVSASNHSARKHAKQPSSARKNGEIADNRPAHWPGIGEPKPTPQFGSGTLSLPPIADEPSVAARIGSPVSLGILIETSMANKATRHTIVYSLTDLVRRMGADDEAFILSFSHNLVFEQDLTGDANRLEQAMGEIKPQPGTALMDAVSFAAGHLRRISKNNNRVLLVISDGKNANSRIPALASADEIRASGVKIYCIGVNVNRSDNKYRLEALASATGGTTAFVTASSDFRAAAQQVAGQIGIRFDY